MKTKMLRCTFLIAIMGCLWTTAMSLSLRADQPEPNCYVPDVTFFNSEPGDEWTGHWGGTLGLDSEYQWDPWYAVKNLNVGPRYPDLEECQAWAWNNVASYDLADQCERAAGSNPGHYNLWDGSSYDFGAWVEYDVIWYDDDAVEHDTGPFSSPYWEYCADIVSCHHFC